MIILKRFHASFIVYKWEIAHVWPHSCEIVVTPPTVLPHFYKLTLCFRHKLSVSTEGSFLPRPVENNGIYSSCGAECVGLFCRGFCVDLSCCRTASAPTVPFGPCPRSQQSPLSCAPTKTCRNKRAKLPERKAAPSV